MGPLISQYTKAYFQIYILLFVHIALFFFFFLFLFVRSMPIVGFKRTIRDHQSHVLPTEPTRRPHIALCVKGDSQASGHATQSQAGRTRRGLSSSLPRGRGPPPAQSPRVALTPDSPRKNPSHLLPKRQLTQKWNAMEVQWKRNEEQG